MVCIECYVVPILLSVLVWLWGIVAPYLGLSADKTKQVADKLSPKCPANIPGLKTSGPAAAETALDADRGKAKAQ